MTSVKERMKVEIILTRQCIIHKDNSRILVVSDITLLEPLEPQLESTVRASVWVSLLYGLSRCKF